MLQLKWKRIQGVPCVFYDLSDTLGLLALCGNMISLRSGFCDLVQNVNINEVVFYNKAMDTVSQNSRYNITNLKRSKQNILEKSILEINDNDIIEILEYLNRNG